ncbi:hypothetical protein EV424DRAFT_1544604 [Suillus variegatus]|nr:hypothetical protein EV424DRAFT_1544604 [Suillus variegatus]
MSPEKRIGHPDSRMLAGKYFQYSIQNLVNFATPQLCLMTNGPDTIMEDAVDELAEDGPSYNLGWTDINAGSQTIASKSVDNSSTGPSYDLGWGANAMTSDINSKNMSELTSLEDKQETSGVENDEDAQGPKPLSTGADDMRKDDMRKDDIIDLCDDDPVYDLGWGDGFKEVIDLSADQPSDDRYSNDDANPRSGSPVRGGMDIDGDWTQSLDIEIIEDDSDGTQTILRVNCRLKTIGNTMTDEHIRAIVENATNGLTATRAPANILIDNRNLLGGYANTRDRDISFPSVPRHYLSPAHSSLLQAFRPHASHLAFLRDGRSHIPVIPEDWALNTTNVASEWVEQQFLAHVSGRPLIDPPAGLDLPTLLSCGHLAFLMAEAYQHPIKLDIDIIRYNEALSKRESAMNDAQEEALLARFPPADNILLDSPSVVIDSRYRIILWYIPDALTPWVQNDMFSATLSIGDLLRKSITNGKSGSWRTSRTHFHQETLLQYTA